MKFGQASTCFIRKKLNFYIVAMKEQH